MGVGVGSSVRSTQVWEWGVRAGVGAGGTAHSPKPGISARSGPANHAASPRHRGAVPPYTAVSATTGYAENQGMRDSGCF